MREPLRRKKRESLLRMTLGEIRRRPTLPGRFQPSTISALRLDLCDRDGNRWIPQAIVTGKERGSRLLLPPSWYRRFGRTVWPRVFPGSAPLLALALSYLAPSKPHRDELPSRPTKARPPLSLKLLSNQFFRSQGQVRVSVVCTSCSLFPVPCSLLPRSSPRPISIIKLHTLPHFHR